MYFQLNQLKDVADTTARVSDVDGVSVLEIFV